MKDVNSPVNTVNAGSRLSNPLPLSPGARSNPSRGDRGRCDQGEEPALGTMSRMAPKPAEPAPIGPRTTITGPED
jgi:hypothetical protein